MKKFTLALAAATATLALAACGDDTVTEETTIVEAGEPADAADTVIVEEEPATGDSISVSEDGVSADISDGGTSVSADLGDDPSISVETN